MKKLLCVLCLVFCILVNLSAQQNSSDWISEETVASVIKLSSLLSIYTIENLPDDYSYKTTENGEPDFENAIVKKTDYLLVSVGTGVIVTEKGLIMTNAHVTDAYDKPEIETKLNPAGKPMYDKDGKVIKTVIVNVNNNIMFVGLCTPEDLKKNNDCQKLSYMAEYVTGDVNYEKGYRDRALLQITKKATMGEYGIPIIGEECSESEKFPFSELADPFEHSYLDTKVRAVGFPGVGDPNRSSKTAGEFLGYENESVSNILHTSWISNGNSGGGLFYKDKLIGINTWDNRSNASRPVAIAQPNTYWDELFAYYKYMYNDVEMPKYDYEWIEKDPSTDSYKNDVYIGVQLVEKRNSNKPITDGSIYIYDSKYSEDFVIDYIGYEKQFESSWEIVKLLWQYEIQDVVNSVGISEELAMDFKNLTKLEDMRSLLVDTVTPYYDLWCKKEFVYKKFDVHSNGKTFMVIPENTKFNLVYETPDGTDSDTYILQTTSEKEQGPYTLKISADER